MELSSFEGKELNMVKRFGFMVSFSKYLFFFLWPIPIMLSVVIKAFLINFEGKWI